MGILKHTGHWGWKPESCTIPAKVLQLMHSTASVVENEMFCSWAWSQKFPGAAGMALVSQQTQWCYATLSDDLGWRLCREFYLNTVRPEEWILLSGVDVLVPLEETPSVSYLPGEVPCPDDFVRWLCIPVTLVWCWRRDILSLDTKGILETKYRAESGTKLRRSWRSILETNGQWTGFFLLFIFFFLLHLLYRGWNQGTLCMRVTPFSEGKYIFRMLCSNPFQWGKDLLSVLQFKPR